jgi:hypothetical protein
MQYLLLFHGNRGFANAPHCYVISRLLILLTELRHNVRALHVPWQAITPIHPAGTAIYNCSGLQDSTFEGSENPSSSDSDGVQMVSPYTWPNVLLVLRWNKGVAFPPFPLFILMRKGTYITAQDSALRLCKECEAHLPSLHVTYIFPSFRGRKAESWTIGGIRIVNSPNKSPQTFAS